MRDPRAIDRFSVAVVDNHDALFPGIEAMVSRPGSGLVHVGSFTSVRPVLALASAPDVVVLDLLLGRQDEKSTSWIPELTTRGSVVVVHTSEERPVELRRAVRAGAAGLALKNDGAQALLEVVLECAHGGFGCTSTLASALLSDETLVAQLSPREVETLSGIDDGLTRQQIARRLGIEEGTVRSYVKEVRRKYVEIGRDVTNASSLVREATRDGYLD